MKELSIEEKAKRYDEALERAKDMLSYKEVRREDMEYLFPELKESEDERIRKAIVATIHLYYGEPLEDEAKEMIDWIEKQEQKPTDEEIKTLLRTEYEKGRADAIAEMQKPAWSEEDEERIIKNACEFMRNHIDPQLTIYHEQTWCKRDEFIEKFINYMKGE